MERQVMLRGPNQAGGKSTALCMMITYHLTGLYPDEYTGIRFDHPIEIALGGVTGKTTRNLLTDRLFGAYGHRGTGFVPAECLDEKKIFYAGGQVRYLIDYAEVKHHTKGVFDGWSRAQTFSYAQGWESVQGFTLHGIFCDEEPLNFEMYDELMARTNVTGGICRIAETPLQGESEIIHFFEDNEGQECRTIPYTIDDCSHLDASMVEDIKKRYENHPLAEARLYGRPVRGEGLAFPTRLEKIVINPFSVPTSWPQIIGVDFPHTTGYFAAVKIAIDTDNDVYYVVDCYKDRGQNTSVYIERLKAMGGEEIPVAWPHDGGRDSQDGSGATIAGRYKKAGIKMNFDHAHMLDIHGKKAWATLDVVELVIDRMESGRFKIFATCTDWIKEKRSFKIKDGKIERRQDDHTIDASLKAVLDARFAKKVSDIPGWAKKKYQQSMPLRQPQVDFFGGRYTRRRT